MSSPPEEPRRFSQKKIAPPKIKNRGIVDDSAVLVANYFFWSGDQMSPSTGASPVGETKAKVNIHL